MQILELAQYLLTLSHWSVLLSPTQVKSLRPSRFRTAPSCRWSWLRCPRRRSLPTGRQTWLRPGRGRGRQLRACSGRDLRGRRGGRGWARRRPRRLSQRTAGTGGPQGRTGASDWKRRESATKLYQFQLQIKKKY